MSFTSVGLLNKAWLFINRYALFFFVFLVKKVLIAKIGGNNSRIYLVSFGFVRFFVLSVDSDKSE